MWVQTDTLERKNDPGVECCGGRGQILVAAPFVTTHWDGIVSALPDCSELKPRPRH